MTEKKKHAGKDTIDTSTPDESPTWEKILASCPPEMRMTSEESEELDRLLEQNPTTVTFHNRPPKGKPPENPQELVDALKKRGFRVNVLSNEQLEARRQSYLEMEAWHGKRKK